MNSAPLRTPTSSHARMLGGEYFLSQEIFDRETTQVFGAHWLCVGRSEEWPQTGFCRSLQLGKERLLVVRAPDGVLRGMHNVCLHRGALLQDQTPSQCRAIVCPYHGWAYDLTGKLVAAPHFNDRLQNDAEPDRLAQVGCAEWQGFVWLNLSRTSADFSHDFRPVREHFAPWQFERLEVGARQVYDVAANWKLLFQNFSECYHCPGVHPRLNRLTPYRSASNDLIRGAFQGGPMLLEEGVETLATDGRSVASPLPGLDRDRQRQVGFYTLFPSLFLSPHPEYLLAHRIERVSVDRTRVVCEFLFDPAACRAPGFDPSRAVTLWDEVNRQDWHMCELSQQGIASSAFRPGLYSPLESVLARLDQYYLEQMRKSDGSHTVDTPVVERG